jgi:hypothetical protein
MARGISTKIRDAFIEAVKELKGDGVKTVTRDEIHEIVEKTGIKWPQWLTTDDNLRVSRGVYRLPASNEDEIIEEPFMLENAPAMSRVSAPTKTVDIIEDAVQSMVPSRMKGYVPFGHFSDVRTIIKSKLFYPVYITGLSGNGKTVMVEEVCAQEKREMVRTNITSETDEDDLIGGFRLVNGETIWHNGPVVVAMERGAVLLLDEVDLGSNKLMCLQPVLEGKPIYIKKINRVVKPVEGFNVIATANTKGKGSDDGRFIGTNVMNEAFLERFSVTMEQDYPSMRVEEKILNNVLAAQDVSASEFTERLVTWADVIRKSFHQGAVTEIISTRRLVHICQAYAIFNESKEKAIQLCLNRFDHDTKQAFMDLYKKLDASLEEDDSKKAKLSTSVFDND